MYCARSATACVGAIALRLCQKSSLALYSSPIVRYKFMSGEEALMKTLQEIEKAIETLPWLDRLRLYKDMPQLIGGDVENLDWQRLALDRFFQDDSPDDHVYDHV